MAAGARHALAWLLALLCLGAEAAPQTLPIALRAGPPVEAARIANYADALNAILRVLLEQHSLPAPSNHTLEIHASREDFALALIDDFGMRPSLARNTASFAKAAVGARKVLVNDAEMAALDWPQRILTLAHELVHAIQQDLAGHQPVVSFQWLMEGHAEWVAVRVMHALGFEDFARARARMTAEVREVRRAGPLPALHELDTLEQWVRVRRERGFNATYPLSFLVADFLLGRHSAAAAVDYFRRFRASEDAAENFRAAFGETPAGFQRALQRHLAALLDAP